MYILYFLNYDTRNYKNLLSCKKVFLCFTGASAYQAPIDVLFYARFLTLNMHISLYINIFTLFFSPVIILPFHV